MRPKTLFILFISFLVVIGAYLAYEKLYAPREEEKKEKEEKVFPVAEEDVTKIELASPADVIVLEKDDGTWVLTEPVRTAADTGEVASLISFALDAEIQRDFGDPEEAGVDLAEFGLDFPVLTVTLFDDDAASILTMGDETPEGDRLYALIDRDGDRTLALIDSLVLADLDRDVPVLRKKDITAFRTDEVERFSVTRNGNTVTSERTGGDDWMITDPVEFGADTAEVYDVLDYVTEAEAIAFFDGGAEDLAPYGLDDPAITLVLTDMGGATSTLIIGDEDENGDYFALWEGMPWVCTVSNKVKNKLTLTEESLMEKVLLDYTVSDVTGFTLETELDTFVVSRGEEGWKINEPEELPGDKTTIDNLLFDFKNLRFDEVVEKPTVDSGGYGLDDPFIALDVVFVEDSPVEIEDGETTENGETKKDKDKNKKDTEDEEERKGVQKEASLIIGDRKDTGIYVRAMYEDGDFVAFVIPEDLAALAPTLFDLRDKTLLTFDEEEVERVRIEWEGEEYEFVKKKKKWKMIAPEEADIAADMMTYLLLDISDLSYYDVMYDTTENLEPFGLDDPAISIMLLGPDDHLIGEILLGDEDEEYGHYSVISTDLPMIYAVTSDYVEDVHLDILDVQE